MDDHDEECEEFKMKPNDLQKSWTKCLTTDWLQESLALAWENAGVNRYCQEKRNCRR